MKVIISYPPLASKEGSPTLGQNRQFQYFKEPTYIYPVVPAQAATLLKQEGHEVIWNDCIACGWNYQRFLEFIRKERPDLVAFETKTPVVKQHWRIIDDIKAGDPAKKTAVVLFGDHVTALPEESLENSQADFVLTGGDYDFLLLNLCNNLDFFRRRATSDERRATNLEPGIWYRDGGLVKNSGSFKLNHDLDALPFIDRELTSWQSYSCRNGNYKRIPGTYIMSGRDCWYHNCTFCSWAALYPEFRVRSVGNVLDEIGALIDRYKIREIMDDTGCFPVGEWLENFCSGLIKRGYNKQLYLDCNMRFGALSGKEFSLMKKAGFRLLLFGLESANQGTLDRINKGLKAERIVQDCRLASKAGLFPHITIMFGYPWESYPDALETFKLGSWLIRKGYAHTMQATLVVPYPGTSLFGECREKGLLTSLDWDDYDMRASVLRSPIEQEELKRLAQSMYRASFHPEFVLRKMFSVRDPDDLKYYFRAFKKVLGHIFDFKK